MRSLGSNLQVSPIGFGCMSLPTEQDAATRIVHQAIDSGVNFFDTADVYENGLNEERLGRIIRDKRNRLVLATKVGNVPKTDGSPGFNWDASRKHILESIDKSLHRLQTDYIDLYQLHGGMITDSIDETISAFEELRELGKIRYYGISSIRPNVIREYVRRSSISSVMMQYSLLDRRPEEEAFTLIEENGIGILVRGAVAQGLLGGKTPKPYLGHDADAVGRAGNAVESAVNAIRYVLSNPAVSCAVMGIRTEEHLKQALEAADKPAFGQKEIERLQNAVPALKYKEHR